MLGGWPVQFLPATDALDLEAIETAIEVEVDSVRTWVMTVEHLAAIALRTGRAKDHNRLLQFLEQNAIDNVKLMEIVQRHGLAARWQQFERKYLRDSM